MIVYGHHRIRAAQAAARGELVVCPTCNGTQVEVLVSVICEGGKPTPAIVTNTIRCRSCR